MQIITLTTDLGLSDHYVAALKGQLYGSLNNVQVVDISHDVQAFNIAQTAFFLNNVFDDFPKGTIHFLGVDALPKINIGNPSLNLYPLVMKLRGQYIVGCDNGVFSLINDYQDAEMLIRIDDFSAKLALRHPTKYIYLPTIQKIAEGVDLNEIGEVTTDLKKVFTTQPILTVDLIKGAVIHIDKYGNVITNITEKLFNEVGKGNPFTIYFKNARYFIETISTNYHDVPTAEKLALFNENGFLEIAINKGVSGNGGGAGPLLGLNVNDIVRMEFHPKGSKDNIESLFNN
ncbi:SAM hydrolase/SAM-dependent halogenase family protein [Crocinitomix catalasitica]|uniref:SAM hydrolase/SAM-dependent halogenase family protein n=1 Tax=Crocinitomix catalasitica TaxID=184607 RepID=UPI000686EF4E|nr:SAM-dependent chlorinase/fluorinase [Crocinitomix catalasitica]